MITITIHFEVHRLLSRAFSYAKMPFIFLIWLLVGSCVGIQQGRELKQQLAYEVKLLCFCIEKLKVVEWRTIVIDD